MSGRMKARHISEHYYKVIIEMPSKKKLSSFISEKIFSKLQTFLGKYGQSESTAWEDLAKERLVKYKPFGLALRGARFREGMSQKELAKCSGITQENISRMENGQRPIGENVAKKLAKALNIDFHLLLSNT